MQRFSLIFLIVCHFSVSFAADYSKIDKQSTTEPINLKTAPDITAYLIRNITTPSEKVRAIYYWIAHNIRYDVSQLKNTDISYSYGERNLLDEVLQNRRGVCQHYSELFHACCLSAGIKSYVISGYTKTDGQIAALSHAWNAVVIDGKYTEIDATWAAGYVTNGKFTVQFNDAYFMISPTEFIKTHIPFDPIWQFLDNPLSNKEFSTDNFSKLKTHSTYNFVDSINVSDRLDSLSKLVRQNRRIKDFGLTNDLLRNYVYRNQQNIVQLKYNQGVVEFNKAIEAYNIYIMNKNKQFNGTSMEDNKVLELLANARSHAEFAEKKIQFLNSDNSTILKNISDIQTLIVNLKKNIDLEELFVEKYIKTLKPFRMLLFYK
jgi:hypothetical protein